MWHSKVLTDMGEGAQAREVGAKDYFWGAIVANAPVYMVNSYRDMVAAQHPIVQMLIFGLTALGGGLLAGFSIARKSRQSYQKAGLTTGLLSYIAYSALLWITGFGKILIVFEDASVITGFVAGGALGAKLWEKRHLWVKQG